MTESIEELFASIIENPESSIIFSTTVLVTTATLISMVSQLNSVGKTKGKEKEIIRKIKAHDTEEFNATHRREHDSFLNDKLKKLELENLGLKESIEQNVRKLDTLQSQETEIKRALSDFSLLLKQQQNSIELSLERQKIIEDEHRKVKLYREAYAKQLEILNDYYYSGLKQSERSFNFAIAAVFGFFIIAISVLKPIFFVDDSNIDKIETVIQAGTGAIISAFSGIFFALSNQTKRDMINFSDKIRVDRKFNESLKLIETIEDSESRSKIQATVGLSFSGISISEDTILSMFFEQLSKNSKNVEKGPQE